MERWEVCVIGGGPAGYAAAMRAVDFGKRVLLVERGRIGGAGIFDGALSSKALWELSQDIAEFTRRFDNRRGAPRIPFTTVAAHVEAAVNERSDLLVRHLEAIRQQRPGDFAWEQGEGRLADAHTVEISGATGTRRVEAEHIVLATGSRPRILPTIPVDEKIILTSDGISALTDFPKSIVILGAGVIGCEFATIFSNFGRTQVNLIDKEPRILPFEDEDVARVIEDNLEAAGVLIHHGCRLVSMGIEDGQVAYTVEHVADKKTERFVTERGLISVGRVPNVEGLGLAEAGIECSASGHIVDHSTRTSVPHIYAVGDLTADIALLNVGELEGRHAAERMFGTPSRPMAYNNISTIMFLSPETAGVGMNEITAQKAGQPYRVASYAFQCIPRAVAMRKTQGFFKILVTDDAEMKVLGMRAIGEHASSAIQAVALLIAMDKGIEELAELIHPHPSIIEGIQECVRMLLGKSILKPTAFAEQLACRRWHDGRYQVLS